MTGLKTINFYGCSYVSGIDKTYPQNYVFVLSKMYPNIQFNNLAHKGFSNQYIMDSFINQPSNDSNTLSVVGITGFQRLTYYDDTLGVPDGKLIQFTDNYAYLDYQTNSISWASYPTVHSDRNTNIPNSPQFRDLWYKNYPSKYALNDTVAIAHYIQERASFTYTHCLAYTDSPLMKDIDNVPSVLGQEKYLDYCIDSGYHFGQPGLKWMANWISSKLNLAS